ncbi:MAG TPA: UDP-glucose/GDP-mannose dehydrogenase family protein [Acidimicrobiales bacterium]|nr:UDP-glucose/GDP-mannose dehydrogenase family protein [Acidimicrobiales bacterium]
MSSIAVIGTGYVGLTTGAYLAHLGHTVVCADVVPEKVERLQRGELPIFEPGLEELVREGTRTGRLSFVLGASNAVTSAEFVFLCVPTPQGEDGRADLSYVQAAANEIGPLLRPGSIVINKSTVPVGSARVVERALRRSDVSVVSNPEFLREGSALHDCLHPDRIVIGCDDRLAADRVATLFDALDAPVIITDPQAAETIKYVSNAFLATKISFINAVAAICDNVGADVAEVVRGVGLDSRIGAKFLQPGPGWGGSCFPKDTLALIGIAEESGYDFALLKGVVEVNDEQYERVAAKIQRMAGGMLRGRVVAVWGLTFKANTDDQRESPALHVIRRLLKKGAVVTAYDPTAEETIDGVELASSPYTACQDADVLAVLTEWPDFADLDLDKVAELMATPRMVDARNLFDPDRVRAAGLVYEGIGRR